MSTFYIMRKTILFSGCIVILFSGCGNRNNRQLSQINYSADSDKIYYIDIEQIAKNTKADTFTINSLAKNITFIPLETTNESLLSTQFFKVAKIKERYYISWSRDRIKNSIMEFDSNGRFIANLIQRGQGPQELPMIIFWSINRNAQLLCASSFNQILFHSFETNTTKKYNFGVSTFYPCLLNDGTVVDQPSFEGTGDTLVPYLHFRNQAGEIIHTLLNQIGHTYDIPDAGVVFSQLYPSYTGDVLFQDIFNDTIYCIKSKDDIKPYIILNRGSKAPTIKKISNQTTRNQDDYITIHRVILETPKYFFIKYRYRNMEYCVIWNKQASTFIANINGGHFKETTDVTASTNDESGFAKYLTPTGEVLFIPIVSYFDGKLYSVLDAEQAMEFLPDINEDDNPVLMIIDIE